MSRKPRNEKEALLRAIALGENVDGIKPNADENYWLKEIAKSGGSGGIKDVAELPKPTYKGTTVPNSGYVEKVYFNTELSADEVKAILSTLTPNDYSDEESSYRVLFGSDDYSSIYITLPTFYIYVDGGDNIIFDNDQWVECAYKPYELNQEIVSYGFVIDQNDKLSSLISTTPFEKVPFNDKTIYRLEEQDTSKLVEVKGQPIPCDDKTYIDKIYINKNLTVEQVIEIIESANLAWNSTDNAGYFYYKLVESKNNSIIIWKNKDGSYEIVDGYDVYLFSNLGFGEEPIEFKSISPSTYEGQPIGLQNDKLKDLFYYTTYATKSDLYTYDGEWKRVLTNKDLGDINTILDAINGEEV